MSNIKTENRIKGYRPDIDGLRAVAVSAVVAYHAYPKSFKGGFVGVDIFFVISGFLISGIILNALESNSFTIKRFYQRRVCRLFPALILVLMSTMVFGWFSLLPDEFTALGKHIAGGAGFIANLVIWREVDYWDIAAKLKPLLHLWSLGIEEQFYIFFPCMLLIAWKKKLRLVTLLVMVTVLSFYFNIHYYKRYPSLVFYAPYTRFWELLAGAVLLAVTRNNSQKLCHIMLRLDLFLTKIVYEKKIINDGRFLNNTLSFIGFMFLFLAMRFARVDEHYPNLTALFPVLGTVLIIYAGPGAWLNHIILSNRIMVGLGLISYPLYLWHWPILSYFNILGWADSGAKAWDLIRIGIIASSVLLAFLTYKYIESPIRFKIKTYALKTTILICLMFCIAITGIFIYLNQGFPDRAQISSYKKFYTGSVSGVSVSFKPEEIEAANQYAPKLHMARYRDVGSSSTVAVIGDSHSDSAFSGIAEKNAELKINTFGFGSYQQRSNEEQRALFELLKRKNDIQDVFIFFRGIIYLVGIDTDSENGVHSNYAMYDKFEPFLQDIINTLIAMDKRVFLVSENPVLSYAPRTFISRPFGYGSPNKPSPPTRQEIVEHQREYLVLLDRLEGATIINSIDAFCPKEKCLDFLDDGQVLYYDKNHLSVSGSQFQAELLLAPYLEEIARSRLSDD